MEEGVACGVFIEVVQVVYPSDVLIAVDRVFQDDVVTFHIQRLTKPHAHHVPSGTDHSDHQCRHYVLSLRHEYDVTLPIAHITVTFSVVIVYCLYVRMMTVMSARTQITVTVSVVIMYGLYVREMTSHHREACIVSLFNISTNSCSNQSDNRTRADRHLATHTSKKVDRQTNRAKDRALTSPPHNHTVCSQQYTHLSTP